MGKIGNGEGCWAGAATPDPAGQCSSVSSARSQRNDVHDRRCPVESQVFDPKAYALSPLDLIPHDDGDDADVDVPWLEYCRVASTLDRSRILEVVLSNL